MFSLVWNDAPDADATALGTETQHMSAARKIAAEEAANADRPVLILRGETPCMVILPDGTQRPPEGVKATVCEASEGRACWCHGCRADRAEDRAQRAREDAAMDALRQGR